VSSAAPEVIPVRTVRQQAVEAGDLPALDKNTAIIFTKSESYFSVRVHAHKYDINKTKLNTLRVIQRVDPVAQFCEY
jgi:hypothetical protein